MELREWASDYGTEVVLNTSDIQAGRQAFAVLAGYIFVENKGEKKFEMAAPVMQAAVPGARRVQLVLPKGVTQESNAEALGPRVQLHLMRASQ